MIYESVAISIVPRFPIAIAREDNIALDYVANFSNIANSNRTVGISRFCVHISRKKQFSFSF